MPDDRSISEMRNLGPAVEKDLEAVGITTAQQVIDLGVEETFIRMLLGREEIGRSAGVATRSISTRFTEPFMMSIGVSFRES